MGRGIFWQLLGAWRSAIVISALIITATFFLCYDISRPLIFDEALYGGVVTDTLKAGDIANLHLNGNYFFEKPPLFFWAAMASATLFGLSEFALRLPNVIFTLVSLWLVYGIVKELTNRELTAIAAFLLLLFSELFLTFSRQALLDSGVIMCLLAGVFFYIKGWKNPRYYFWLFPVVAVGFLFKSVVIALIIPILGIYSLLYRRWYWLLNAHLWSGFLLASAIVLPWHLWETYQFGALFWTEYIGKQVFVTATTTRAGTAGIFDFVQLLIAHNKPWTIVVVIEAAVLSLTAFIKPLRQRIAYGACSAPLFCATLIIFLFSIAQTHLPHYIVPALPFFAMYIAICSQELLVAASKTIRWCVLVGALPAIISYCFLSVQTALFYQTPVEAYDEKAIGVLYKQQPQAPLISWNWRNREALYYYGGAGITYVAPKEGIRLSPPFYIIVSVKDAPAFFRDSLTPRYPGLSILYQGAYLMLLRGESPLLLP